MNVNGINIVVQEDIQSKSCARHCVEEEYNMKIWR